MVDFSKLPPIPEQMPLDDFEEPVTLEADPQTLADLVEVRGFYLGTRERQMGKAKFTVLDFVLAGGEILTLWSFRDLLEKCERAGRGRFMIVNYNGTEKYNDQGDEKHTCSVYPHKTLRITK